MTVQSTAAPDVSAQLRAGLAGLFDVSDTTAELVDQQESYRFRGHFLAPAEQALQLLRHFVQALGKTCDLISGRVINILGEITAAPSIGCHRYSLEAGRQSMREEGPKDRPNDPDRQKKDHQAHPGNLQDIHRDIPLSRNGIEKDDDRTCDWAILF